jgi:hypothetical protein
MRTVWQQLLDRLAAGEVTICADEVPRWDKNQWQDVLGLGLGLLRETELAESIVCDQCGDAHWAEVYWVTPGVKACFGCETEGVIDIEIDRLRQWRIDADRVAGLVAGSLDICSQIEMLRRNHLWHIGRRRLGGRYRDIFLGVGAGLPVAEMSAAIRSSIGPGSALLLTVGADANLEGITSGQHLLDLVSVSRVEGGRVVIDLDYVEERLAGEEPSTRKSSPSIPAPAGAAWGNIEIIVFDEFIRVTLGAKVHEVGFADISLDQQSQTVELLKLFAAARGTLDAAKLRSVVSGDTPVRIRVLRLRQVLQKLIDVDGNPLVYAKKAQTYTCNFQVRLDRDEGLRAPPGASWLDFAFHERADGRILVSVTEKHQFRAHGSHLGDQQRVTEVAERDGTITRTHSLEEIGLRDNAGRLTEEGATFVQLLRAGAIRRNGNDMVVLGLAQRLRNWTGLDGDPLRLVESSRSWTAVFACSSDIGERHSRS